MIPPARRREPGYRRSPSPDPLDKYSDSDLQEIPQQVGVYRCQPAQAADDSSASDSSKDPLAMMAMVFLANIKIPGHTEKHIPLDSGSTGR
jgi:hypothetical protein